MYDANTMVYLNLAFQQERQRLKAEMDGCAHAPGSTRANATKRRARRNRLAHGLGSQLIALGQALQTRHDRNAASRGV